MAVAYPNWHLKPKNSRPLTSGQQHDGHGSKQVQTIEPVVVGHLVRRQSFVAVGVCVELVIVVALLWGEKEKQKN